MIGLPAHTRIRIAAGVTDMRCRFNGHVSVFRGRRGDIIKLLWWTGAGLCLLNQRLARGRFIWPQAFSKD
ncbi:IS66 family insertion sequence element accessory protein TnpB [Janthinobacterium sp. DSP2-3-3]|uniref:IS66 family insertion sequence element accessory protein TnpB n=1 Tax=unclassified Janthinobacterium TaxID=2610881 RepID=UPI003CFA2926